MTPPLQIVAQSSLGALVQRVRCVPGQVSEDVVLAAIGLLREMPRDFQPDGAAWDSLVGAVQAAPVQGTPPHIAAAFDDLTG